MIHLRDPTNPTKGEVTDEIEQGKPDDDIVIMLSNYFRKYAKHSDAVPPPNLDTLIKGTFSPPLSHTPFRSLSNVFQFFILFYRET